MMSTTSIGKCNVMVNVSTKPQHMEQNIYISCKSTGKIHASDGKSGSFQQTAFFRQFE